jgi:hypothetical protein
MPQSTDIDFVMVLDLQSEQGAPGRLFDRSEAAQRKRAKMPQLMVAGSAYHVGLIVIDEV